MKIDHPDRFKAGTRVLMLAGRHKDGLEQQRKIIRVAHTSDEFDRVYADLSAMRAPHERIYGSAAARDMAKAIRRFKEAQLAAD